MFNQIIKTVLFGLLSYALPASAWLAGSFSPSTGFYHLHSAVNSKQEAIALANKGCTSNSGASDCVLLTTCNGPTAHVIFRGDNGVETACDPDPMKAYKKAAAQCKEKRSNCHPLENLIVWDEGKTYAAAVYTKNDEFIVAYSGVKDTNENVSHVLKKCTEDFNGTDCDHVTMLTGKWWVGYIQNKNTGEYYSSYSTNSKEEAINFLKQYSEKQGLNQSDWKTQVYEPSSTTAPKEYKTMLKLAEKEAKAYKVKMAKLEKKPTKLANLEDCRPKTNSLTCKSSCVNGNCLVTYTNGCTMRVRVNPTVDPFSGMMQFPTPNC
ncbi:DUF4189 domain-containing protein [Methylophilus sp. DW102]|uniref:DUF4189 domain-containing protein n=1 Tax=Methylophilus sp. DW102 TaxID=3095607 RepID=UPI003092F10A|nr:hypothetical protein MTDW_18270 [Methylophilus sp. DW102]